MAVGVKYGELIVERSPCTPLCKCRLKSCVARGADTSNLINACTSRFVLKIPGTGGAHDDYINMLKIRSS